MNLPRPLVIAAGREALNLEARADPLRGYRCASLSAEQVTRWFAQDDPPEVYWHAGNSGGKTQAGVALDLAMCSGRDHLLAWDGQPIALPVIPPPVSWVLGVPSYKLGGGSSILKLRELLGDWPNHETHVGGPDQVSVLSIRHRLNRSADVEGWSKLYVYPYEGEVPEGLRLDGWHCDEPPPRRFLDALRNRKKAGRVMRGLLTATPIERRLWAPIRSDYPSTAGEVRNGRVRIQSSVYDNRALSPADIRAAERAVQSSPYRMARLYGDHVDIAGTCPFDADVLLEMRGNARPGEWCAVMLTSRDGREVYDLRPHSRGQVEVWDGAARDDCVLVICDPSSGMRDEDKTDAEQRHNPGCVWVVSMAKQALLARFNGYLTPHELGKLCRALCDRYENWVFVPEMNGGWGEAVLIGFGSEGRTTGQVYTDVDPTSTTGNARTRLGWYQTAGRRGAIVGALQRALLERSLAIPSRAALENLMDVRMDANDRYDQGDGTGAHAEDMICGGIAAHLLANLPMPIARPPKAWTPAEQFAAELGAAVNGSGDGYAPDAIAWR